MTVRMQARNNVIRVTTFDNELYAVSLQDSRGDCYTAKNLRWNELGSWVFEMSDNSDIGSSLNEKMCNKFGKNFE